MMSQAETRSPLTEAGKRLLAGDCTKCAHFPVCVVNRGITEMLYGTYPQGMDGKENPNLPFRPGELFRLCKHYASLAQPQEGEDGR